MKIKFVSNDQVIQCFRKDASNHYLLYQTIISYQITLLHKQLFVDSMTQINHDILQVVIFCFRQEKRINLCLCFYFIIIAMVSC